MSKLSSFIFISSLILATNAYSRNIEKVVYGEDNRLDVFESPNALYKQLANSTAAMIPASSLEAQSDDTMTIHAGTLEGDGICADAKFAKQQTAAMCSGFLVAPNLLVTAGHCITSIDDCDSYVWVFDYANTVAEKTTFNINKKDVYRCTQIISREQDQSTLNDYALLKLDRNTDRAPLTFRKSGKVTNQTELVVIGHPSGLPTKISDDAFVRANKNKYFFQTNLDTFGGNSGSAVFNSKNGNVEGILVRGEKDYEYDSASNCSRPKVCKMNECRGEDVTRITNIKELKMLSNF